MSDATCLRCRRDTCRLEKTYISGPLGLLLAIPIGIASVAGLGSSLFGLYALATGGLVFLGPFPVIEFVVSLIGLVFAWLLLRKERVLRCTNCGLVVPAD